MKIIEPTKNEIFRDMKMSGCTWCGGRGCECHMRTNISGCFNDTKKRLTKIEYTAQEIEEGIKENMQAMKEIDIALEALFNGI